MNRRIVIFGKAQGLDGDRTTTGATCIGKRAAGNVNGSGWLLEGDSTTPCPRCGQVGTLIDGDPRFLQDDVPTVVDGARVRCGCPLGSNRLIAPLDEMPSQARGASAPVPGDPRTVPRGVVERPMPATHAVSTAPSALQPALQPGFYIVPRSMAGEQVLQQLATVQGTLPMSLVRRLNPTFDQGFKAGELFVLGAPDNSFACTREEADLMAAARSARESLAILSEEEADFMMQHIGEVAGVLSGASLSMGVGKDMLARGIGQVGDTLKGIERLHQREFALHRHLNSQQFFAERKVLYAQLNAQLRSAFLGKYLDLGRHESLRKGLGISTKSLVHHWSKAGAPGAIPGYATHLDEVAKMAKYLKYGGYVAVGVGATSSYMKIYEACRAGETEECKKVRLTETGSFTGGLAGGAIGAEVGKLAIRLVCNFGPWGKAVCGIAMVGTGSYGGAVTLSETGEKMGELIYEITYD
ncbi:PAAR domain-containing protein [Pseudomonas entomophila]|uniref:PAAR domain-containing protein n=1 Tax=Pseudomonas entomophila TaxID=312306 RepID=UPI002405FA47|nr:PAAR domain-containing protein [Pseudomonas entomophila]MDF9621046.1 PAAR domain-containing protein [Pseudomonas entomophila]